MAMLSQFLHISQNFEISMIGLDQVWGMMLLLELFKDFRYWPEIWWDDEQYHEANLFLKWPCFPTFCTFHGTLKFSMIGLDQVWEMMTRIKKCEEITLCQNSATTGPIHSKSSCLESPQPVDVQRHGYLPMGA